MYCIKYNQLSNRVKTMVNDIYPNLDVEDLFIAYEYGQDDKYIVCGCYSLERKNILTSSLFDSFLSTNIAYKETKDMDCYCITLAIEKFVTKSMLKDIFNIIALLLAKENETILVWLEYNGRLIFYPLTYDGYTNSGYPSFAENFADNWTR